MPKFRESRYQPDKQRTSTDRHTQDKKQYVDVSTAQSRFTATCAYCSHPVAVELVEADKDQFGRLRKSAYYRAKCTKCGKINYRDR